MSERMIQDSALEIAAQSFGNPAHPTVLLVMGAMASMLWWPDAFCARLASHGRYVIRYDNRDTGRSTKYPVGKADYSFDDMADDAVRVLDAYGIPTAHVVGMSMGGMLAQMVALKHPARAASLTVISSSPIGENTSALPGTTAEYLKHSEEAAAPDWNDREAVVHYMVEEGRLLAGTQHRFDAAGLRRLVERDFDRSGGLASATNHFKLRTGESWDGRLRSLRAPLLVIHGTADPIFPIEHAEALVDAVSKAKLVRLEGGGHELHEADWGKIVDAVANHSSRK